ncbi:MAG: hypothetical protein E7434_01790 [Ruminococcaceae bacterium]|nr:hypothetical protein [Oscillospiraceae bacterium]
MAAIDNFRSSLHGFNRTDVVQFIQQQTATHDKAMRTLKDENTRLQEALAEARAELERANSEKESLILELEAARLAVIEEPDAPTQLLAPIVEEEVVPPVPVAPIVVPQPEAVAPEVPDYNELELAAYRRAEQVERVAKERAAASVERMKAIFSQTEEKLITSAQDIEVVYDAFKNDYEQLQRLLSEVRSIVDESSEGMKSVSEICAEV